MFIRKVSSVPENTSFTVIADSKEIFENIGLSNDEYLYTISKFDNEKEIVYINRYSYSIILCLINTQSDDYSLNLEKFRRAGANVRQITTEEGFNNFAIVDATTMNEYTHSFIEGFWLGGYKFLKYMDLSKIKTPFMKELYIASKKIDETEINKLKFLLEAVNKVKDLVNEPLSWLDAVQFGEEMRLMGRDAGIKVTVLNKKAIEKENMNGILTVSKGSDKEPSFTILDYKPDTSINQRPFVLIGKGVTFDSGGITLKPFEQMQYMKMDMAGGATVAGVMYAAAKLKLPVRIIGLVPAVENMPGGGAAVPGDIIKMANGMTVEMAHPDAEGRLILADALIYAKRFTPQFIVTVATLTGSAYKAFGSEAIPCLSSAHTSISNVLRKAGMQTYERITMLPNFPEYDDMIKSNIADVKNLGGSNSGMMTAGKFLMRFTEFPLLHLDIAGAAFMEEKKHYRDKGATATGVRLLLDFFKKLAFDELI